jgi:hypothetical protein
VYKLGSAELEENVMVAAFPRFWLRTGHSYVISGHGRYLYTRVVEKVRGHMSQIATEV